MRYFYAKVCNNFKPIKFIASFLHNNRDFTLDTSFLERFFVDFVKTNIRSSVIKSQRFKLFESKFKLFDT